jgi:hypothetical protein
MFRLLQITSLIFALGIVPCAAQKISFDGLFNNQEAAFAGRLNAGEVSTDPAQWDDETRKEFFANMPAEYHQQYLDAYAKLREANGEYWKTRGELFTVIHPLTKREVEKPLEGYEAKRQLYLSDIFSHSKPEERQRAIDDLDRQIKQAKEMLTSDYYNMRVAELTRSSKASYLSSNHYAFNQYPEWRDPDKQTEYWQTLVEETIYLYGIMTEDFFQQAEKQKQQTADYRQRIDTMTFEDLKQSGYTHPSGVNNFYFGSIHPLTDAQKERILNDEPLFATVSTGHFDTFSFPRFPTQEVLTEARNAEREPWRIDATPELSKLAIDQAEVDRWDGSLSLHPFIRTIAERCEGIDVKRLQTPIDLGSVIRKDASKTLSNTHPALMAVIQGEKDIVFSARRVSQAEAEAIVMLRYEKMKPLPALPGMKEEQENSTPENIKVDASALAALEDELVTVPFAKDAFVFLQNRHNPVRSLTLEQYQGIFSGKYQKQHSDSVFIDQENFGIRSNQYQSWKEVGGFGGIIKPFIRNPESGSEEIMQTLVMKGVPVHKDFQPVRLGGMSFVFDALESNPTGIAYSIYHYDRYMVFNANTRVMAVDGVFPNAETIASGKYPLVYECVLVHRKQPGEKVERFVKWLLSDEGQKLVRSVGYVPIRNF